MIVFLDTSSLIKLYYKESGTEELDSLFKNNLTEQIYLSEIAKIEFISTVYKKQRMGSLTRENAQDILKSFTQDYDMYTFITVDHNIINSAKLLIEKFGLKGLRTLDSIQFACAINVRAKIDFAITNDIALKKFFVEEGFIVNF